MLCFVFYYVMSKVGEKISNFRNLEGFYIVLEEISKLEKE